MRRVYDILELRRDSSGICTKLGVWQRGTKNRKLRRWRGLKLYVHKPAGLTICFHLGKVYDADIQAAEAAHAQDTGTAGPSRKAVLYSQSHKAGSSAVSRPVKSGDKFANYSTASQLGLVDEDEPLPTTFEIEQMLKNKETKVGQWESVSSEPAGLSRSLRTEHGADAEEETEGWKFAHRGKRAVRHPYDDDDFDPSAILKMRKKTKQEGEVAPPPPPPVVIPTSEELDGRDGALDREGWSGKIELNSVVETGGKKDMVFQSGGGWVKVESGAGASTSTLPPTEESLMGAPSMLPAEETKSDLNKAGFQDVKPVVPEVEGEKAPVEAGAAEGASGGLFKKRRPPPSSRKK
jgi:WW domain-binding protein 4